MGFVEDMNGGVMDPMLASPVWRGALNAGTIAYGAFTVVIQTVLIVLLALVLGADFKGGVVGVLVLILVAAPRDMRTREGLPVLGRQAPLRRPQKPLATRTRQRSADSGSGRRARVGACYGAAVAPSAEPPIRGCCLCGAGVA